MLLDKHNKCIPSPKDLWDSLSKTEGILLEQTCCLMRRFSGYTHCQIQLLPRPFLSFIQNQALYYYSTNVEKCNNYRHSDSVVYTNRHRNLRLSFNISKSLTERLLFPVMRMNGLTIQFLYFERNYVDWIMLSQVLDHMKL